MCADKYIFDASSKIYRCNLGRLSDDHTKEGKREFAKKIMSFRRPNGHVEQMSRCFDWIDLKKDVCHWRMCLIAVIISGWKVKTFVRRHVKKEILNFEFYQLQLFFADRCVNVKVISTKGDWDRNMGQRKA